MAKLGQQRGHFTCFGLFAPVAIAAAFCFSTATAKRGALRRCGVGLHARRFPALPRPNTEPGPDRGLPEAEQGEAQPCLPQGFLLKRAPEIPAARELGLVLIEVDLSSSRFSRTRKDIKSSRPFPALPGAARLPSGMRRTAPSKRARSILSAPRCRSNSASSGCSFFEASANAVLPSAVFAFTSAPASSSARVISRRPANRSPHQRRYAVGRRGVRIGFRRRARPAPHRLPIIRRKIQGRMPIGCLGIRIGAPASKASIALRMAVLRGHEKRRRAIGGLGVYIGAGGEQEPAQRPHGRLRKQGSRRWSRYTPWRSHRPCRRAGHARCSGGPFPRPRSAP